MGISERRWKLMADWVLPANGGPRQPLTVVIGPPIPPGEKVEVMPVSQQPRGAVGRWWHVTGRDGAGDPPDVDYWTDDEQQARAASNAGHKVDEYVSTDRPRGAV